MTHLRCRRSTRRACRYPPRRSSAAGAEQRSPRAHAPPFARRRSSWPLLGARAVLGSCGRGAHVESRNCPQILRLGGGTAHRLIVPSVLFARGRREKRLQTLACAFTSHQLQRLYYSTATGSISAMNTWIVGFPLDRTFTSCQNCPPVVLYSWSLPKIPASARTPRQWPWNTV